MKRVTLLLLIAFAAIGAGAQAQSKSGFFTTSDGVRIHYLEAGKGPAIVLIPGWTMPAWIWEKQIAHFSAKYHVIAVDPRSQGDSDKPAEGNYPERRARDYKELVDHLKLSPAVLVGWSMGVPEILAYVDQFGATDLRGVVLVDGFAVMEEGVLKVFPVWLRAMAMDRKGFTDRFVQSMYKKPQPESYYERLSAAALKTPTNTAVELGVVMTGRPDLSPILPKLANTPVLCVATKNLIKQIDLLKPAIPNLQSEIFEDSGHALFVDDADRFNAAVEKFLSGIPAK
jgi:microsomal epoxide hydrolase